MSLDEDKRDTSWDNVDEVSTLSRLTERQRKTVRELRAKYAKMPEYDVVATLDMGHVAEVFSKRAKLTGDTEATIAAGTGIGATIRVFTANVQKTESANGTILHSVRQEQ